MAKHFPDKDGLIVAKKPVKTSASNKKLADSLLTEDKSADDYKLLIKAVRNQGENVPAMFNAYIGLTDTMRVFGTILDHDFGSVYETGIMVVMDDLLETKRQRYIQPYIEYLRKMMEERAAAKKILRAEKEKLKLKKMKEKEKRKAAKISKAKISK